MYNAKLNFEDFLNYREKTGEEVDQSFLDFFISNKDNFYQSNDNPIQYAEEDIVDEVLNGNDSDLTILKDIIDEPFFSEEKELVHPDMRPKKKSTYSKSSIPSNKKTTSFAEKVEEAKKEITIPTDDEMEKYQYTGKYRISSNFGKRNSPVAGNLKGSSDHKGIDIACPEGTAIYAPIGGIVEKIDFQGSSNGKIGAGNYISIRLDNGKYIVLMHLKDKPSLQPGQRVEKGQQIAVTGKTGGDNMGAHLHVGYSTTGYSSSSRNWIKAPNYILNELFQPQA